MHIVRFGSGNRLGAHVLPTADSIAQHCDDNEKSGRKRQSDHSTNKKQAKGSETEMRQYHSDTTKQNYASKNKCAALAAF